MARFHVFVARYYDRATKKDGRLEPSGTVQDAYRVADSLKHLIEALVAVGRFVAIAYNAVHTTIMYGPLAAYGYLSGVSVALAVGLIGLAHVGFDRLLGYGLKYPLGFGYTHLGRLGKEAD